MSRNQNSHFALNPHVNIKRSRFDMSHSVKTTFNAGKLVPFECLEVLPGDTFTIDTSILTRMQTLITPLMDDLYLDTYYFFVPNRLLWEHWQNFMGENDEPWFDEVQYSVPTIDVNVAVGASDAGVTNCVKKGTVADYLGMPLPNKGTYNTAKMHSFNHLPFRAYCRVWNEWFRSENLQPLAAFNMSDASVTMNNEAGAFYGGQLLPVNKYRDRFTSALPEPQRGPEVTIGVGDVAPIFTTSQDHDWSTLAHREGTPAPLHWRRSDSSSATWTADTYYNVSSLGSSVEPFSASTRLVQQSAQPGGTKFRAVPSNLWADISAATGISINELRMAFATQRFYEASARSGSRYIEILESMFGVTSPDSRLQRSEYLGGNRVHININQAIQQSETANTPLGNIGAYSLTTDHQNSFTHSFVEHGILLGVMCVRYDHSYQQGFNKHWLRKDKFDYYWPMFANIGEQPIYNIELYATGDDVDNEVFGYNEAWSEYRYQNNIITGEMRSQYDQTLDYWHLGDNYSNTPALSGAWLQEDGDVIDRAIAVSQRVSDQFIADIYINNIATRPMPLYSIPGLTTL